MLRYPYRVPETGCVASWANDSNWRSECLLLKTLLSISVWGQLCWFSLLLL